MRSLLALNIVILAVSTSAKDVFEPARTPMAAGILNLIQKVDFGGRKLQQNPDFICSEFEAASTVPLTCQCQRYLVDEVEVKCLFDDELCGTGEVVQCITQSVRVLLNAEGAAYEIQSCSQFTTGDDDRATCTNVVAATPGNYSLGIESCSTTYKTEECNYCIPCETDDGTLAVTFDCCNVQTDVRQTCGLVTATGATSPQFDQIPEEDAGKCKGKYGPPSSAYRISTIVAYVVAIGAAVLAL